MKRLRLCTIAGLQDSYRRSQDAEDESNDEGGEGGEDKARNSHVFYAEIACCVRDNVDGRCSDKDDGEVCGKACGEGESCGSCAEAGSKRKDEGYDDGPGESVGGEGYFYGKDSEHDEYEPDKERKAANASKEYGREPGRCACLVEGHAKADTRSNKDYAGPVDLFLEVLPFE